VTCEGGKAHSRRHSESSADNPTLRPLAPEKPVDDPKQEEDEELGVIIGNKEADDIFQRLVIQASKR